MIRTIFACFNGKVSHKKVKVEPLDVSETVYRDELIKKQPPRKAQAVKKRVRFSESEPTILGEDGEKGRCGNEVGEKEGVRVRVRVKLTKEEAAQLLSKCNEGVLELKDAARELVFIPVNRFCVVSDRTNNL